MKPIWKHIIASFIALLVVAYCVFGWWMSRHAMVVPACKQCQVRILDSNKRQYVSSNEIIQLIQSQGLSPVGKPKHRIDLQSIEDAVRQHSMVRQAECYKTIDGNITIALTQRRPVLRVITEVETYFIDSDRKMMPVRASVTTPMLVATGQVSHRMAQTEASDFAQWLQKDRYWRQYICRAQVVGPKMVHLKQIDGRADIILGDWQDYERKLNKLRRWYEADTALHQQQYQQVDLRFHNQVIGIKN